MSFICSFRSMLPLHHHLLFALFRRFMLIAGPSQRRADRYKLNACQVYEFCTKSFVPVSCCFAIWGICGLIYA